MVIKYFIEIVTGNGLKHHNKSGSISSLANPALPRSNLSLLTKSNFEPPAWRLRNVNAMAAEIHRRRCIYVDGGMETAHRRKTAAASERKNGGKKLLHSARPTGSSKWEEVDDENGHGPGTAHRG